MSKGTLIRSVLFILALLNQGLAVFGKSPLPFDDATLTTGISAGWTIVTGLWAWWKNNSFTKEAVKADQYMKSLKGKRKN